MANMECGHERPRAARLFPRCDDSRGAYRALERRMAESGDENSRVIQFFGAAGVGKTRALEALWVEAADGERVDGRRVEPVLLDFAMVPGDAQSALIFMKMALQKRGYYFPLFELALYGLYLKGALDMDDEQWSDFLAPHPLMAALMDALDGEDGVKPLALEGDARAALLDAIAHQNALLRELDALDWRELYDRLPELFARDVNERMGGAELRVFIDSFERLPEGSEDGVWPDGVRADDAWLCGEHGLIRHVKRAVFAIAGRNRLRWGDSDPYWADPNRMEAHLIRFLSDGDVDDFLARCGMRPRLRRALCGLTEGDPALLDMCADLMESARAEGRQPRQSDFGGSIEKLVERHSGARVPESMRGVMCLMSGLRRWDASALECAVRAAGAPGDPVACQRRLIDIGYVTDEGVEREMQPAVAWVMVRKLPPEWAMAAARALVRFAGADGKSAEGGRALAAAANLSLALRRQAELADHARQTRRALALREQVVEICRMALGEAHPETLHALDALADACHAVGEDARMVALQRQLYDARLSLLGETHEDTRMSLNNLAYGLGAIGDWERAAEAWQRLYDVDCRALGEAHADTLDALRELANACSAMGDHRRALELLGREREAHIRAFGEDDPDALEWMARECQAVGDDARMVELLQQAYDVRRHALTDNHPDAMRALEALAHGLSLIGEHGRAVEAWQKLCDLYAIEQREDSPEALLALEALADECFRSGDSRRALELHQQVYAARRRAQGEAHPDVLEAMFNMAIDCDALGDHHRAALLGQRVYEGYRRARGEEHPDTLRALHNLALSWGSDGDLRRARELMETVYDARRRAQGESHPDTVRAREALECIRDLLAGGSARGDAGGDPAGK